MASQEVSFKTLDGLIIRGALYPADKRGPAVVMTPGVCSLAAALEGKCADSVLVQLREGDALA